MALKLLLGSEATEVEILARRPGLVVAVDGRRHQVALLRDPEGRQALSIDGRRVEFVAAADGNRRFLRLGGRVFTVTLVDPRDAAAGAVASGDEIRAPMPGSVVSQSKAEGEAVARGETIMTIESMKLQTALAAPRDGVVEALLKRIGQTFEKDEVVVRLRPPEAAGEAS